MAYIEPFKVVGGFLGIKLRGEDLGSFALPVEGVGLDVMMALMTVTGLSRHRP